MSESKRDSDSWERVKGPQRTWENALTQASTTYICHLKGTHGSDLFIFDFNTL